MLWILIIGIYSGRKMIDLTKREPDYTHDISSVWIDEHCIYKRGQTWAIKRELECLSRMSDTGYVPLVEIYDTHTLKIQRIRPNPVTNTKEWMSHYPKVLKALKKRNINHCDLTSSNIIPYNNKPFIIDFGESLDLTDKISKPKRPHGDLFWLYRGMIHHLDQSRYPVYFNQRAPEMWHIIKKTIPQNIDSIMDLGAGHCDLAIRFMMDKRCIGLLVEKDEQLKKDMTFTMANIPGGVDSHFIGDSIEQVIKEDIKIDIMICCSVLPYLDTSLRKRVVEYMVRNSKISYIEIQYEGDGPGQMKNESIAHNFLIGCGFTTVEVIGETFVETRNKYRQIWKCKC